MHCFLFLRLIGFYIGASKRTLEPLVIYRDKHVLDANAAACQRNVYVGMALSEAKAILHGDHFVEWQEEQYRNSQKQWLDLCTEFSDVIEPCEQHSAWIDLSLHPDAEGLTMKLLRAIREQTGLSAFPGLAGSKWIARLASERCNSLSYDSIADSIKLREPVTNPRSFLSTLKTSSLTPVDPLHRQRLEFLGYSTIGEVAKVPLHILRSQFGEAATQICMCSRGGYFEAVEAHYPPGSLSARLAFDGLVTDFQVLDNALRELAVSLSEKLLREDLQSKHVTVTLEHDDGTSTILRRRFTKPIQNHAAALGSLRLMLSTLPEKSISSIRARLEEVTASKRVQRELTGHTSSGDRERGAKAAFQHVRTVFGDGAIQTGNDLVEPRRKKVLRAWKDATGWT